MNVEECMKEKLWPVLVETAHALVMYPGHKAYTHDIILNEKPDVTPEELVVRLGIPLGEALTILFELAEERKLKP